MSYAYTAHIVALCTPGTVHVKRNVVIIGSEYSPREAGEKAVELNQDIAPCEPWVYQVVLQPPLFRPEWARG